MRKATILFTIITFLSASAHGMFGAYGISKKHIILSWGPSYRIDDNFYHHFELAYESFDKTCLRSRFKGYGLRMDWFNDDNFSLGIKMYKPITKLSGIDCATYWGISPEYFQFKNQSGLNLKPEVGFRIYPFSWSPIDISLNVSYGYHIPIISEDKFLAGRHDFSASVGLAFDVYAIRNMFSKKKETETPTEDK